MTRAALVVATSRYADPALARLRAAARDAEQMAAVLGDPGIGAFEVTLIIDPLEREIRERAEGFLAARGPDDMVVVYLSCHGLRDARDRLYFAASDTRRDRLAATGVESAWLLDRLDECAAASQVVILDCCVGAAFARGAKGAADPDLRLPHRLIEPGRGRAVLTASRAAEGPWKGRLAGGAKGSSAFTLALAEGLRTGAADTDRDGYISIDDAYSYAYEQVIASGARQTPQRYIFGVEGKLWLARNPAGLGNTLTLPDVDGRLGPRIPRGRKKAGKARAPRAPAAVAAVLVAVLAVAAATALLNVQSANAVRVYSGASYRFDHPSAIAVDGTHIWVANLDDAVTELNAGDGSLARILSPGKYGVSKYGFSSPSAIAVDGTHIWVANAGDDSLTELNAGDGRLARTLIVSSDLYSDPSAIALDGTHFWLANAGVNSVTELNAGDGRLVQTLTAHSYGFDEPSAIAVDGTHIWVANSSGDSVTELNAGDGSLVRILSARSCHFGNPSAIAVDGTHIWVANSSGDSVTELNAGDGSLVRILSARSYHFSNPGAIAVDGTHLWVANSSGDSVTELPA